MKSRSSDDSYRFPFGIVPVILRLCTPIRRTGPETKEDSLFALIVLIYTTYSQLISGLTGGGTPRPGEISLAHCGVLFLDELPEFERRVLEVLREPLESGRITISRAARQADFPARFQLIAAMNPCPCGYLGHPTHHCRCTPEQIARYQGRISGPLLDRIDIQIQVTVVPQEALLAQGDGETSCEIAARVAQAYRYQISRQGKPNSALQPAEIDALCAPSTAGQQMLQKAMQRLNWSARATHRVLKLARTIADLAQEERVQENHIAEAIQYRRALNSQGN